MHFCNDYCMATHKKSNGGRRYCKNGRYCKNARHSVKEDPTGSCITPGLPLTSVSYFSVSDNGVELLNLRCTHSRKVNQTSLPTLQAWRGIFDIQLMHYKSDPRQPNVSKIQVVICYIVSYVTKKVII